MAGALERVPVRLGEVVGVDVELAGNGHRSTGFGVLDAAPASSTVNRSRPDGERSRVATLAYVVREHLLRRGIGRRRYEVREDEMADAGRRGHPPERHGVGVVVEDPFERRPGGEWRHRRDAAGLVHEHVNSG